MAAPRCVPSFICLNPAYQIFCFPSFRQNLSISAFSLNPPVHVIACNRAQLLSHLFNLDRGPIYKEPTCGCRPLVDIYEGKNRQEHPKLATDGIYNQGGRKKHYSTFRESSVLHHPIPHAQARLKASPRRIQLKLSSILKNDRRSKRCRGEGNGVTTETTCLRGWRKRRGDHW